MKNWKEMLIKIRALALKKKEKLEVEKIVIKKE